VTSETSMAATLSAQELVETTLQKSRADGCVVVLEERRSVNLRWAANTLTTNGVMNGRTLTVISVIGESRGAAAGVVSRSGVAADEDIEAIVRLSEEAARAAGPAEDAQPLSDGAAVSGVGSFDEEPGETSPAVFASFAPALGDAFGRARSADRELFGFAEHGVATTYLGATTGARLRHQQPAGRVELTGKSNGRSRSTWVGRATRDFADVDVGALEADVNRRLDWSANRIDLAPGRYDTVLPPPAVADLMIYLYWSAGARDAEEGRSVFSKPGGGTRIGEQLATRPLRLWSDPDAAGLESIPFVANTASTGSSSVFDDALPLSATDWIHDGHLAALLQTRFSAELTGQPFTPAIDNLLLGEPGATGSVEDVVRGVKRGLLLTCLWYIREVDPQTLLLTGLTRDGVFLIENGEVVAGVNNFRFNESPVDLLGRVSALGGTARTLPREWNDWFTRTAMPPLRIPDFNMSTTSEAQ
jgi:predicted Zn-dependent protease